MLELVQSGGWLMLPLIVCSVVAFAIVCERLWSLQTARVCPNDLVPTIWKWVKHNKLDDQHIVMLQNSSPLGKVLAVALINRNSDRAVMKESIEETGRHVVHELERYLNTLGTIASITPLLGLLGTVVGMIKVFTAITAVGVGDTSVLAGGISEALITTATGLTVAIPSLMFYRYLRGRVDLMVITMEQEALKLVEVLVGVRKDEAIKKSASQ